MESNGRYRKAIVLTPGLSGADGVSEMSRQIVRALAKGFPPNRIQVWSLMEREAPRGEFGFRGAFGSRLRFALWGLEAGLRRAEGTLVLVVHLHLSPVALPLALRGATVIQWLIGVESWRRLGLLEGRAVGRARALLAISRHTVNRFLEFNPEYRKAGVQVCHLAASNRWASASSAPGGEKGFALIVARMASAERYKGHDLLLDVWPRVLEHVPTAKLVVAGDGDDRPRLESRARAASLSEHVLFLGSVSDETLATLYARAGFFVMPSRDEGFGVAFLEAMCAGKACIGARGAAEELIEDGATGLIVDPSQPEEIERAVVRLFREAETRERMGREAARRAAREFSEERFQSRLKTCLGFLDESGERKM